MTDFSTAWQTAEAPTQGEYDKPAPPANGTYTAMLFDASGFTSKKGNVIAKFEWQIVSTGEAWGDISTLVKDGQTNDMAMGIVKDKLFKMGVPNDTLNAIDSLETLDKILKALVGDWFEVTFKTNAKGFTNCYIEGKIDAPAAPPVESVEDMFPPKDAGENVASVPASEIGW